MSNRYIAVFNNTAFSGIGIIDIKFGIDDYCIVEVFDPNGVKRSKNKIYMDCMGRNYIKKNGNKYYLDEFLKTN